MTTKLSDLRVARHKGWYEDTWTEYERVTVEMLVAALIAEGGTVATYCDSEWDGMWFGNEKREWVDVPPGRYLVFPIPAEES